VADSSMLSFMAALYRGGAPSNKPLERAGVRRRGEGNRRRAGRSTPIRSATVTLSGVITNNFRPEGR
jgi:hypothetical protein